MDPVENNYERPAGFWIRLGALILDGVIFGIPSNIISSIFFLPMFTSLFTAVQNNPNMGPEELFPIIMPFYFPAISVMFILVLIYYVVIPALWNGFTPGKRIVGIRIVRLDGNKVGFGTMLLRYVVGHMIVDAIALGGLVSAIMVGASKDKRSLHDLVAGTAVRFIK